MSIKYTNDKTKSFDRTKFTSNPVKKDKTFFCNLGDNFMLKNEYRKAVKEYLVSLMIDKNNVPACMGASKAYKNLKEYDISFISYETTSEKYHVLDVFSKHKKESKIIRNLFNLYNAKYTILANCGSL